MKQLIRLATFAVLALAFVPVSRAATIISPATTATSAQQTIADLDAQRAANGLPAGITEDPTWSSDCMAHDQYMELNGDALTHSEVVGNPGYSPGGAFAAANSVLSQGTGWEDGNPYEHAPLHLDQLLTPSLDVLGSADGVGFSCTTTFPGWTRPAPASLSVYSYPGPGASIYPSETAHESPFTPGQLVGLKPNAKTGPNLFVFVVAPGQDNTNNPATLSQATLSGPKGTVSVVTVDGNTLIPRSDAGGCSSRTLSCFISPGGLIIPVRPLTPNATYTAHVMVTFAGVATTHHWSFTTLGIDPESQLTLAGRILRFASRSPAPVRVTFARATGAHAPTIVIEPGHGHRIHLAPGSWQACGRQHAFDRFASFQQCLPILVTGVPKIKFDTPRVHDQTVGFPIRFTPVLRGRRGTLTITPLTRHCNSAGCRTTAGTPSTRALVLRAPSIQLPLPDQDHGFQLTLAVPAFQLHDAPWLAAQATSRPFVRG